MIDRRCETTFDFIFKRTLALGFCFVFAALLVLAPGAAFGASTKKSTEPVDGRYYVVQKNDTLTTILFSLGIAPMWGKNGALKKIIAENKFIKAREQRGDLIFPKEKIFLPASLDTRLDGNVDAGFVKVSKVSRVEFNCTEQGLTAWVSYLKIRYPKKDPFSRRSQTLAYRCHQDIGTSLASQDETPTSEDMTPTTDAVEVAPVEQNTATKFESPVFESAKTTDANVPPEADLSIDDVADAPVEAAPTNVEEPATDLLMDAAEVETAPIETSDLETAPIEETKTEAVVADMPDDVEEAKVEAAAAEPSATEVAADKASALEPSAATETSEIESAPIESSDLELEPEESPEISAAPPIPILPVPKPQLTEGYSTTPDHLAPSEPEPVAEMPAVNPNANFVDANNIVPEYDAEEAAAFDLASEPDPAEPIENAMTDDEINGDLALENVDLTEDPVIAAAPTPTPTPEPKRHAAQVKPTPTPEPSPAPEPTPTPVPEEPSMFDDSDLQAAPVEDPIPEIEEPIVIPPAPMPTPEPTPTPTPTKVEAKPESTSVVEEPAIEEKLEEPAPVEAPKSKISGGANSRVGVLGSYAFSAHDSTDNSTGSTAHLLSKPTLGVDAYWQQLWTPRFTSWISMNIQRLVIRNTNSGQVTETSTDLSYLELGGGYQYPSFEMQILFRQGNEPYVRAPRIGAATVDALPRTRFGAIFSKQLLETSGITLNANLGMLVGLPTSTGDYTVNPDAKVQVGVGAIQQLKQRRLIFNLTYAQVQGTSSISNSDDRSVTVNLGMDFDLGDND